MNKAQKQKVREEFREKYCNREGFLKPELSLRDGHRSLMDNFESYLIQKLEDQEWELVQDIEIKVINPCDYEDVHKAWKLFTSSLKQDENKR